MMAELSDDDLGRWGREARAVPVPHRGRILALVGEVRRLRDVIREVADFLDHEDHPYPSTACPVGVCNLCNKANRLRALLDGQEQADG